MSSVISIVLTDGTTPLTHNPTNVDTGGTSEFRDTSVARNVSASVSVNLTENSTRQKVRTKRSVPLYTVVDGIPVVTGYYRAIVEEEFPLSMTPTERAYQAKLTDSLASNTMIKDARHNGEAIWS